MSMNPTYVFDPFTLTALIGIAIWLDRRLRNVESKVAYRQGFEAGQIAEREVNVKDEYDNRLKTKVQ